MTISTGFTAKFSGNYGDTAQGTLASWRASPPPWLPSKFQEIEESYKSVTWEWRHTPLSMKLVGGGFFGGGRGYRITALFEDDGRGHVTITVNGEADEETQKAIQASAEQYFPGGIV